MRVDNVRNALFSSEAARLQFALDNRLDGDNHRQYVALCLFDKFDLMKFPNIYSLFRAQTAKYRGKRVYYAIDREAWSYAHWEDFEEYVNESACALLAKGLTRGASVAI